MQNHQSNWSDTSLNTTISTIADDPRLPFTIGSITLLILSVLAIVGNLLNLIGIYKSPSLRSLNNALLIALTITDFCTGLILIPLMISTRLTGHDSLCELEGFMITVLNCCSLSLTVALSFDRCHAVVRPYSYMRQSNAIKYVLIVIAIIFLSNAFAILPVLGLEKVGLGHYVPGAICWYSLTIDETNIIIVSCTAGIMIASVIMIFTCYAILFVIAYQKSRDNLSGQVGMKTSLRTVILIVGTNMICWIPTIVILLLAIARSFEGSKIQVSELQLIADISFILLDSNIAVNPIIYLMTNSTLRKNLMDLKYLLICKVGSAFRQNQLLPSPICRIQIIKVLPKRNLST